MNNAQPSRKYHALGDLCNITMGATPPRNEPRYWGHGYPWVSISDLNQGKDILTTRETITQAAIDECRCSLVQPGTLLMSFKLSIGKLGFARVPLYTNEAIVALEVRNSRQVLADYLYYALQAVDLLAGTDRAAKGATLNLEKLERLPIPLVPLAEQHRITTILVKADRLRRLRRYVLEMSDNYLQAVFVEMFGDPCVNPKEWQRARVLELGKVQTGNTPPREHAENYGSYIEWIKSDDIISGKIVIGKSREMLSEIGLREGRSVEAGSILVTCIAGSPTSIGNVGLSDRKVAFNQQINAVTPHNDVNSLFLYGLFLVAKPLIQHNTTLGMKRIITKSKFEQLLLIKPPLMLQERFSHIITVYEQLRTQQREALRQAEHLFQTLLYKAFSGELSGDVIVDTAQDKTMLQPDSRVSARTGLNGSVEQINTYAKRSLSVEQGRLS